MTKGLPVMLAMAMVFAAGCNSTGLDVDLSEYDPVPPLQQLDSRVRPAGNPEYWELRFSWGIHGERPDSIIGAGGLRRRSELPPSIQAALDALRVSSGFQTGCLPRTLLSLRRSREQWSHRT